MFTDLEEFLDENLGFGTLDLKVSDTHDERAAKIAAFFVQYKKWMREKPEEYRAWRRFRYHQKKQDPVWKANARQKAREWAKRNKEKLAERNRIARRKWWAKKKQDPIFMAKIRERDRLRKRKKTGARKTYKSKWQQLEFPISKAA